MELNALLVFVKVVEAGSFTGAARLLGMPKSTVSRRVSELEVRLGARLLQRTTRKLGLTDAGLTYYHHAARAVAEVEEAELAVTRLQEVPRGTLRVTAPLNFGFLGPAVAGFMERYPEVQVELTCTDRVVDLVQEGFDLGVRAGPLADSTLVARSLGALHNRLVASPGFAQAHRVAEPEDLERLPCLAFGGGTDRASWRLVRGARQVTVTPTARLQVNDFDYLEAAARAGVGVAMLPAFRCEADLLQGRLQAVLPEWGSPPVPLNAVYPTTRHLSPKVKAFVDHLQVEMRPRPPGAGSA